MSAFKPAFPQTASAPAWRRAVALWLLAFSLLAVGLGPLLARMHQILHPPQSVALQLQQAGQGGASLFAKEFRQPLHSVAPQAGTWAHALWAMFSHHHSLDCQSLDQLAHAQAPGAVSMLWLSAALPLFLAPPPAPWRCVLQPWGWTARGPPTSSIAAAA